ncbi:MAG: Sialic acid TRAP transporter permease protein SiaT [Syntrophorhabdus sp. PtaU1.Bin058]|nr:MAG: Sialic acid TRAP transporter permease protein SiaT [Syntrophorhabdus sp. PtaU1.Bin058]
MSLTVIAAISIVLLCVLFTIAVPIGFSMALVGFLGFAYVVSLKAAFSLVAIDTYNTFANYGFTVVPLFILMGHIGANAGVAKRLYSLSNRFIGHIPGGLALATIVGAVLFKSICGSAPATSATFAKVAVPEMDRYGYDRSFSCATVATVGTLGNLLPPSVAMIIYAIITEQSIGRLFLAGVIPGLLVTLSFLVTIVGWCSIRPAIGPRGERFGWKERLAGLSAILPVAIIFILVVGTLMLGYFTPTEAGSVGTFAVLIWSLLKRDISFRGFIASVLDSLGAACMVLMLIAGATILGHFFAATRMPFTVADWLGNLSLPKELIMVIIMLVYLVGGSFIDDIAFVILITPILIPVINKLGFDPIWYGIMVMVTLMIGVVIPPVAINVFIVSSIANVPQATVYNGIYRYLIGLVVCAAILLLFPQISLWLPNLIMG